MAEAIMNRIGGEGFRAFSATETGPASINPMVADLLKSNRLPPVSQVPGTLEQFCADGAPLMDFVIMLQPRPSDEVIARIPGNPMKATWRISDATPTETDPVILSTAMRKSFLELENRIKLFALVQQDSKSRKLAA